MEILIADFVQFSRARAKNFLNFLHFYRSLTLFVILFGNSYINFMLIIRQFHRIQPPGSQGSAEIKKVAYWLILFTPRDAVGGGYSTSRGRGGGLVTFSHTQNPVIEIYQCNLFIKYDINRYKESFFVVSFYFFSIFNNELYIQLSMDLKLP